MIRRLAVSALLVFIAVSGLSCNHSAPEQEINLAESKVVDLPLTQLFDFHSASSRENLSYNDVHVHYLSDRYLSMSMTISLTSNQNDCFQVCSTVDIAGGTEIYVGDLIDLNDDFFNLLSSGVLAKSYDGDLAKEEFGDPADMSRYNGEELREFFDDCNTSITSDNYVQGFRKYKKTFYLSPGKITIVNLDEMHNSFYIELEDIESFLKVPAW